MDRVKRVIHCDRAYKMGLNGKNITVAVMDTGIAPHLDFDQRILHFEDFCQKKLAAYDDNGHGTHVAGIIGGSGLMSKDKRGVRLLSGVAPRVRFVVLKVLDRKGNGVTSHVLEGMDWLLQNREKYQVKILNISVGMMASASCCGRGVESGNYGSDGGWKQWPKGKLCHNSGDFQKSADSRKLG